MGEKKKKKQMENVNEWKKDGWRGIVYLLERRSMLLSGSEKLESTVQKESDMLMQTRNHCCDTAAHGR